MNPNDDDDVNNIRVCVRVRPLNEIETERGDTSTCTVMPDGRTLRMLHFAESRRKWEAQMLKFEKVFGPDATQIDLFHQSGVEAFCDSAADGFAATVFCFGQTGSGKTFTMTGPIQEEDPDAEVHVTSATQGIQFRAAHYFAKLMEDSRDPETGTCNLVVKAAMYEIYNEQVNDLLNETANLKVRWAQTSQSFFIEQLMLVTCSDLGDLLAVLQQGLSQRKRSAHLMNQDSSRSHVVLTLGLERHSTDGSPPKLGKINFVDLAGSEKLRDSGSQGTNATETKNINTSLLALGKVISALAARSNEAFVPYRDSTLTRLLMDTLGGNARTMMLACVTPSSKYAEESLKTIRYAVRASSIVNAAPTVRVDPRRLEVFELRTELEMVKKENAMLKERLAQFTGGGSMTPPIPSRLPSMSTTPTHESPEPVVRQHQHASNHPQYAHAAPSQPQHQAWGAQPELPAAPVVKPAPKPTYQPPFRHVEQQRTASSSQASVMGSAQAWAAPAMDPAALASPPYAQQPPQHAIPQMQQPQDQMSENADLRQEVAQLRNMILESRANAIANSPKSRRTSRVSESPAPAAPESLHSVPPQSQSAEPSHQHQGAPVGSQFAFRPAQKKSQRLGFLQPQQRGNEVMDATAHSVQSSPAHLGARAAAGMYHHQPDGTISSTTSYNTAPVAGHRPPAGGDRASIDGEVMRMQAELDAAHGELAAYRRHNDDGNGKSASPGGRTKKGPSPKLRR